MKTAYQKLNSFEIATVVVAVIGFLLIGVMVFRSLTPRQQDHVALATVMFDLQAQAVTAAENVQSIFDIQAEFYNQFYIAFAQVAVLPEETFSVPQEFFQTAYNALANYSDQVAENYNQRNAGKVAGAGINKLYEK